MKLEEGAERGEDVGAGGGSAGSCARHGDEGHALVRGVEAVLGEEVTYGQKDIDEAKAEGRLGMAFKELTSDVQGVADLHHENMTRAEGFEAQTKSRATRACAWCAWCATWAGGPTAHSAALAQSASRMGVAVEDNQFAKVEGRGRPSGGGRGGVASAHGRGRGGRGGRGGPLWMGRRPRRAGGAAADGSAEAGCVAPAAAGAAATGGSRRSSSRSRQSSRGSMTRRWWAAAHPQRGTSCRATLGHRKGLEWSSRRGRSRRALTRCASACTMGVLQHIVVVSYPVEVARRRREGTTTPASRWPWSSMSSSGCEGHAPLCRRHRSRGDATAGMFPHPLGHEPAARHAILEYDA